MEHQAKCQACNGRGWILANNNEHGLRVEKCDACEMFENDDQAATAAWPVLSKAIEKIEPKAGQYVLCECGNCDWRGDVSECNEIHKLLDRVETGEEFPAGECPECGALTYLVRQARHDAVCRCTRRWQCPSCNHALDCSYEQIVEIGTPHCPHCEIEMTMA